MSTLNSSLLPDIKKLSDNIRLPEFDIEKAAEEAHTAPQWIHFGAGNIFRGFIAKIGQRLLEKRLMHSGIIAAETFDYEIIDRIYRPFDNLTMMVDLAADGSMGYEIIGSVAEAIKADFTLSAEYGRLHEIFASPSLQLASFTITEKGYALRGIDGEYLPVVLSDVENGPSAARHAMSIICALAFHRYKTCCAPIAFVSMDNCSENGRHFMESVLTVANLWLEKGFVDRGFINYLSDPIKCAFPWSMIDKITPRPDSSVEEKLTLLGFEIMSPITTAKGTYIAPFVNAEIPQYLVIEDSFPNGRPPFEAAGVYMTDRETVNKAERMKVMTCLNPLHTALAVFGCLLGYNRISDEMKDEQLAELVRRIGYDEGMPVVVDPQIISPQEFLHEVLTERLPNPFIPDMPQRIATDTSQKMPVRFGQTIRAYLERTDLSSETLICIPLVIAGWLRYLLGIDDSGEAMEVSPDPMLPQLREQLSGIVFEQPDSCFGRLDGILSNKALFAADLCACGLSDRIYEMLAFMLKGRGAVRAALAKWLN